MLYAQFYQKSAISDSIIEACGGRSVIILDARFSPMNNAYIAKEECIKRGYLAWAIYRGESFSRSNKVSGPHILHQDRTDNTAFSASYGA